MIMNMSKGENSFFPTCTFVDISVASIAIGEFPSKGYKLAQIAFLVINIILLLSTILIERDLNNNHKKIISTQK